jgi:hypothetical protein
MEAMLVRNLFKGVRERNVMKYIEHYAVHGFDGNVVKLLLSNGFEQNKIQSWCRKHPRNDLAKENDNNPCTPDIIEPCEGWEASLQVLAVAYASFCELHEWEMASSEVRTAHATKVARLARELADALTELPQPGYPLVLRLFDEDCARDILKLLPKDEIKYLMLSSDPFFPLAAYFSGGQRFPPLLRRLADYAEKKMSAPKRQKRPQTGHSNSRAFALHMAERITKEFKRTPNEIIAAFVFLKYPELDNPPNADTIREWRGVK